MRINAREELYKHVELFGEPALFTDSLIDGFTVPKGFYFYDLHGPDYDTGNYAGTVLTPKPITIPKEDFRQLQGKLNFLGDCMTLEDFCTKYGLPLEPSACKFILRPASPDEAGLFFTLPKEQDAELGAIGHVRIDFGREGKEFWHTWWPRGDEALNSTEFKAELTELVNELRETGPLKNLNTMYNYCAGHNGEIKSSWRQNYGYVIETENYRYYLRCSPGQGDYHAYLTAFDLRIQKMNMEKQSKQDIQEGGMQLG